MSAEPSSSSSPDSDTHSSHLPALQSDSAQTLSVAQRVTNAILDVIGSIPASQIVAEESENTENPEKTKDQQAKKMIARSARQAGLAAGSLALPPGILGWLTILPEMLAVWRIQAQLVADLAALYGQSHKLTKVQMLYCLFRHTAAQAVRDLAVRTTERALVQSASQIALQQAAQKIGLHLTQKALSKSLSRWIPIIGAMGVGSYAYYDTTQVGKTARAFLADLDQKTNTIENETIDIR